MSKCGEMINWIKASDLCVVARGDNSYSGEPLYQRLPRRVSSWLSAEVQHQARYSAGVVVKFNIAADEFWVRYSLIKSWLHLSNMSALAASGLDVYTSNPHGGFHWLRSIEPQGQATTAHVSLARHLVPIEIWIYAPLFNGIEEMEIGVIGNGGVWSSILLDRKVVMYGSSVTQGGCVSRSGMALPAVVGRLNAAEVYNLGFSGCCDLDIRMARYLAEICCDVIVLEATTNIVGEDAAERLMGFIAEIRACGNCKRIIIIEEYWRRNMWAMGERRLLQEKKLRKLRSMYQRIVEDSKKNNVDVLFIDEMMGRYNDLCSDGIHLNETGVNFLASQLTCALLDKHAAFDGEIG